MRILHVGLCVNYKDEGLNYALRRGFDDYQELNTGEKNLNQRILSMDGFDVAFFQIQAENIVSPATFAELRARGVFTVNWSGDMRNGTPSWYFTTGADLTLFSNEQDVHNCRTRGLKSDFLQIGIDPEAYNRFGEPRPAREVVFMANNYGGQFPLGGERQNLIRTLQSRYGNRFGVYGNGWQGAAGNLNATSLEGQREEARYYNSAKIAINHSHFNCCRYTSDRMFRILGSGCFCLTHHYHGIEKDFQIGEQLITYTGFQDMIGKIDYYLSSDADRQRIADAGYLHCQANFTYKNMSDNLKNLIKRWQ